MRPLLVVAAALAAVASAQAATVSGAFDATRVPPGEVVTYTITVSGPSVERPSRTPAPDFRDFQVLSGPSTGRSTQISMTPSGTSSSTIYTYSWRLLPRKEGLLAVPPVEVTLGAEKRATPRAELEVAALGAPPAGTAPGAAPRGGQPQAPPPRARSEGTLPWEGPRAQRRTRDPMLVVRTVVDDADAWLGEEVVVTHVLDFDVPVTTYAPVAPAEFPGFAATPREVESSGQWVEDRERGVRFKRAPLARWTLVPLVAGTQEIPAQAYRLDVETRDELFPFFSGGVRSTVKATAPVKVNVKPLPAPAPDAFSGGVGSFQLAAELSAASVAVGDGATLTVTVSGTGNFEAVGAPKVVVPPEISLFDPEVGVEVGPSTTGHATGSKKFAFPLLVRGPGRLEIPPVRWAFFDPRTGRYVLRESAALVLEATPSNEAPVASLDSATASPVEMTGSDIHHVRSSFEPAKPRTPPGELPGWAWAALPIGPALALLSGAGAFLRRLRRRNPAALRAHRARSVARTRVEAARKEASAGRLREAADAVARAVSGFVADRLLLGEAELSPAEAADAVEAALGREVGERVLAFLSDCDRARFAGSAGAAIDAAALVARGEQVLAELEPLAARAEAS